MVSALDVWTRCQSGRGRDRHTVYWNRPLPDGRRLSVARLYENNRPLPNQWRWRVYDVKRPDEALQRVVVEGLVSSVARGRVMAERAAGLRRPFWRCHRPPDPAVGIDWTEHGCPVCGGDRRRPIVGDG